MLLDFTDPDFESKVKKLILAVSGDCLPILNALIIVICSDGGTLKQGQAVRGGLAKEIQETLDSMSTWS